MVLREALLRSGVGVVVYGGFKVTLQASSQSFPLPVWFGAVTGERVDLLLVVFIPVCAWSSLILATGFSFWQQRLSYLRFSKETTDECFQSFHLSVGSLVPRWLGW